MSRPPQPQLALDVWPRIEREDLDDFLAEVADAAGLDAARFLVARFGGLKVSVPKHDRRLPSWLRETSRVYGLSLVRTIIRLRGGEVLDVPSPGPLEDAAIRRAIGREFDGRNVSDLAVRYRRSARFVRDVAYSRP